MTDVKILDLKPVGRYADGTPYYKFHNPFPNPPRRLPENFPTPEEAFEHGRKYVVDYECRTFPGGMGACLGVAKNDNDIYQAVISTYYSNS